MNVGGMDLSFGEQTPVLEVKRKELPPDATAKDQLVALLEEDFEYQLLDNPEYASQAGFHEHGARLQSLSPASYEMRIEHNTEILQRLSDINLEDASIGAREKLWAELLREAVEGESRAFELGCHLMPINSIGYGGVHENFIEMLEWMPFEDEEDLVKYAQRLMAFPEQVQGYCDLLAYGSCMRGITASKSMMRNVPQRLQELLDSDLPELRAPAEKLRGREGFSDEAIEQVHQAVDHCFKGGLLRLQDFMNDFYGPRAREEPGMCALKEGEAMYAKCLQFHTSTTKTPEEIHEIGLKEVARLEARFQAEVLDAVGFKDSFSEFVVALKQDPTFFYETEDEIVHGYKKLIAKIEAKLPEYFDKIPKMPLEVVPKQSGCAAFYMAGTADGKRPGRFHVNVTRLHTRPKYEMTALALHEGLPGHHFQGAIALENTEIPDCFRYIEDRRYEFGPGRRPLQAGYLEGWALYCEHLGEEMGMYETPQDLFGRLSWEMTRAVRLVVDTGIHAKGWSVEKAIQYMQEKTGMAAAECEGECHRYASWPGQACAYKTGEIVLKDLRTKAEEKLGTKFDLKAFHNVILDEGPVPLHALEGRVDRWIEEAM